ncbi:hypothetical protein VTJ83DRAFT_1295 [Remersonia thermophila]|uniref:Uncharacterized protein n=1 Tax=Remersonia thermophila TaxID=72144 RepID=A0ABR4DP92_9PEZI
MANTNTNSMAATNTNVAGANTGNSNGSLNANRQTAAAKDSMQEERELEDMLDSLNQAHLQLRSLRSALPRMLESLSTQQSSPQAAYEAFVKAVEGTNKDIESFRSAFAALQTEGVFARAYASRKENPTGLKQWRPTEHPDWADPDPKKRRMS